MTRPAAPNLSFMTRPWAGQRHRHPPAVVAGETFPPGPPDQGLPAQVQAETY